MQILNKEKSKHTGTWYIDRTYILTDGLDMLRYIARNLYVWPGGYELSIYFTDGSILCGGCIKDRYRVEMQAIKDTLSTPAGIIGSQDIEDDTFCDHCNKNLNGYL